MSDIFVSYTRADRDLARRVRNGLASLGVDVLWDESMPAVDWQEYLENSISDIVAVVVIWTPQSSSSGSVRDEARLALETDKLVNIVHDVMKPRFPYDRINGLSIDGWVPGTKHGGWARIVSTVDSRLSAAGSIQAGAINAALANQLKTVADLQLDHAQAQRDVARQSRIVGRAERDAATATAQLSSSEAQLSNLKSIAATKAVMAAAWSDRDEAKAELDRHERTLAQASTDLSDAEDRAREASGKLDDYLAAIGASATVGAEAFADDGEASVAGDDEDEGDDAAGTDIGESAFVEPSAEAVAGEEKIADDDLAATPAEADPDLNTVDAEEDTPAEPPAFMLAGAAEQVATAEASTGAVAEHLIADVPGPPDASSPPSPASPDQPSADTPAWLEEAARDSTNAEMADSSANDDGRDGVQGLLGRTDPPPGPGFPKPALYALAAGALVLVVIAILMLQRGPAIDPNLPTTVNETVATAEGDNVMVGPAPGPTANPVGWIAGTWGVGKGTDNCSATMTIRFSGDDKLVFTGSASSQEVELPFTTFAGDATALQTKDYQYRRVDDDTMRAISRNNDPDAELKRCGM